MVGYLPSMLKTLGSIPITTKTKTKMKKTKKPQANTNTKLGRISKRANIPNLKSKAD